MDAIRTLLDLAIIAWPVIPPNAFHGTVNEIDNFTFKLAESKIAELSAISTTSALVAGILAAIYSWPIYASSPWPAKTLYGSAFIFSLVSIRKALQQNYILRRLEWHSEGSRTEAGDKIRRQLAKQNTRGEWVPSWRHQMVWNSSVLFLNLSIIMMTIGYGWTMVAAAVDVNWDLAKPDTKVALGLIAVSAISLAHYVGSGVVIYTQYTTSASSQTTNGTSTNAPSSTEHQPLGLEPTTPTVTGPKPIQRKTS